MKSLTKPIEYQRFMKHSLKDRNIKIIKEILYSSAIRLNKVMGMLFFKQQYLYLDFIQH